MILVHENLLQILPYSTFEPTKFTNKIRKNNTKISKKGDFLVYFAQILFITRIFTKTKYAVLHSIHDLLVPLKKFEKCTKMISEEYVEG